MRISTNMLYDMGAGRISEMQGATVRTQQQISSMKRILSPADDPIGSARVLELSQSKSINEQYAVNRNNARTALAQQEGALGDLTKLVQDIQDLVVKAGNPSLGNEERRYLAVELQGRLDDMMGVANSKDGTGNYMFGGYNVTNTPFTTGAGRVNYNGDQGQRNLMVGNDRQIALNSSGSEVFERVRTGNGTFVAAADANNTGTGVPSQGVVTDGNNLTFFKVVFAVDTEGVTTYDIVDPVTGESLRPVLLDPVTGDPLPPELDPITGDPLPPPGEPFVAGDAIEYGGMQFTITGQPADQDSFLVKPSENKSVFTSVQELIDVLSRPVSNDMERTKYQNGLNQASLEMTSMLDNLLAVRASVGARLQEIERLDSTGLDRDLYYETAISEIQDLDYVKALSDLARQQVTLEAAQKTFVTVSGLSLFKML